jgi:hypothetical protein
MEYGADVAVMEQRLKAALQALDVVRRLGPSTAL